MLVEVGTVVWYQYHNATLDFWLAHTTVLARSRYKLFLSYPQCVVVVQQHPGRWGANVSNRAREWKEAILMKDSLRGRIIADSSAYVIHLEEGG